MTDPTPEPAAPVAPVAPATKPEHLQVSTYVGVLIAAVGNIVPYVTPQLLESLHVPPLAAQLVCSAIGAALVAYREKTAVPSTPGAPK